MKFTFYKIVVFNLAFIYVFASMGVSVISHYCGGELQEVAWFTKPDSCCGEEDESEDDGCCKNETRYFSYQNDFIFITLNKEVKKPMVILPIDFVNPLHGNVAHLNHLIEFFTDQLDHPPPDIVQRDIVSVSVLRI